MWLATAIRILRNNAKIRTRDLPSCQNESDRSQEKKKKKKMESIRNAERI